jgi:hypothetical protein
MSDWTKMVVGSTNKRKHRLEEGGRWPSATENATDNRVLRTAIVGAAGVVCETVGLLVSASR